MTNWIRRKWAHFGIWFECLVAEPNCRRGKHFWMTCDFQIGPFKYRECFWCGMRHPITGYDR